MGVDLTLEDFQRISDKTPFIADLKPSGKYVMEDLHKVRRACMMVQKMIDKMHLQRK